VGVLNYVRATHHDVRRFIVGNEMDANSKSNVTKADYVTKFGDIAAAMRAIDPTVQIGAPAPAYFEALDAQWVRALVRAPQPRRASFIDYHAYGAGNGQAASMDTSWRYDTQIAQLRAMIGDPSVGIEVGEYNMNWGNDPQNNTQAQTVWVASALGSILSGGAVAFQYGDKNNALGLVADGGRPKASYWGMGMFTGAGEFRHFGTSMVSATSSTPTVRVFASTDQKNIVVANTGGATYANVRMSGFASGAAQVWQSTDLAPTRLPDAGVSGGSLGLTLPPRSVTTLVLGDAATPVPPPPPITSSPSASAAPSPSPTPTPAATPTPTPSQPPTSVTHGLTATYFDNLDLTGAISTRLDPTINFDWHKQSPAAGIAAETFSARWTGQLVVDHAGDYTFTTTSDDGVRLWVDDTRVVDAWTDHSRRDDHATVTLAAGNHDIRMEYYNNRYDAVARLAWSGPGVTSGTVPTDHLLAANVPDVTTVHGLTGAYYGNTGLTGTPVTRLDSTVNFNWGTAAPVAGIGADHFSVRWTGQVQPMTTQTYTFQTASDDGVRLWVDGKLVVDHWSDHSWTADNATVALVAGHRYDIRMEYYENAVTAVAMLRWSSPTIGLEAIPAANLWTVRG